jgi:hypothetical protein
MKLMKIILPLTLLGLIGYCTNVSWIGLSHPRYVDSSKKQYKALIDTLLLPKADNCEKEFWALIHSDNPTFSKFCDWHKKYVYAECKEIKLAYTEILNLDNESTFSVFLKLSAKERKAVNTIDELKKLINKKSKT